MSPGELYELSRIFIFTFIYNLLPVNPVTLVPVFYVVVFLVFMQYRRASGLEQRFYGRPINNAGRQVLLSTGLGLLGGFLASVLIFILGFSLEQIGLYFVWPVALLLLLVHPRFLCFAYAGGIVGLAVMAFRAAALFYPELDGYPLVGPLLKIHLPALLGLIGLLHLMEALLIFMGGHRGSSPLYFKREGEVVGGFSLQRFWPMPLVALVVTVSTPEIGAGVDMPEWWPLIKATIQPGPGETLLYLAVPVAAGLGYADLALSSTPREKSIFSARCLACYSIALLGAAVAAEFYPLLTLPAVLLAPLGHELVVVYGNRREFSRAPRLRAPAAGVQLMMVLPDSAAARAGLREADVILKVNGAAVQDYRDLLEKVESSYFMVLLEGVRDGAPFSTVLHKRSGATPGGLPRGLPASPAAAAAASLHRCAALGLIAVPPARSPLYVEVRRPAALGWLKRLVGRRRTP